MCVGETYLNYSWVLLTALYEFVISKLCVLVPVHIPKNLVHALGTGSGGRGKGARERPFRGCLRQRGV